MEMKCYRKIQHISYEDHVTNEKVCVQIQQAIGPHKDLLTIERRRKLKRYGHVSCLSDLAKTILQRTLKEGEEDKADRKRGEQTTWRNGQSKGQTGVRQVPEDSGELRKMEETGREIINGAPTTPRLRDR